MTLNTVFGVVAHAWPLLLSGLITTLLVTIISFFIGLVGGTCVGVLSNDRCKTVLTPVLKGYVLLMRGTPVYVQILIAFYVLPELLGVDFSPLGAGILALGLNSIAYVAEIIHAGINGVPAGQWDAASVLGYSHWQTCLKIILPQAIKNALPALVNEITALLKETSVLAAIGVLELTKVAMNLSAKTLDPIGVYIPVTCIYFVCTAIITGAAHIIKKKIEGGAHAQNT